MISINNGVLTATSLKLTIPHFELNSGDIIHLKGQSGSGKSLFLKSLCGQYPHHNYFINLERIYYCPPLLQLGERTFVEFIQEINQFSIFKTKNLTSNFKTFISERHQPELINTPWHKLSNGQRQLVFFYFTLFLNPQVLLIDESFSFLDQNLLKNVVDEVYDLHKKLITAVLFVSHHQAYLKPSKVYEIIDQKLLLMKPVDNQ
ncbi:ABC transporter ATP-binding protein [Bacteriovoracaceae bacterium]|nr:ABC transporter ATP-binding protein [Bacteriovoracaceae bacterium]